MKNLITAIFVFVFIVTSAIAVGIHKEYTITYAQETKVEEVKDPSVCPWSVMDRCEKCVWDEYGLRTCETCYWKEAK